MNSFIYALAFVIICFLMWLSIVFSLLTKVAKIDELFSSIQTSAITYIFGILVSLILTIVMYCIVHHLQLYFK